MTTRLRRATLSDANLLANLNLAVHQVHVEAQPERYKPLESDNTALIAWFENNLVADTTYIFIAENETGEAMGYVQAFLQDIAENIFIYGYQRLHIDQMSVNAPYRSQGIGHLLMARVIETAKTLQVDSITLGVAGFNQRAIRFYEQQGFSIRSLRMIHSLS